MPPYISTRRTATSRARISSGLIVPFLFELSVNTEQEVGYISVQDQATKLRHLRILEITESRTNATFPYPNPSTNDVNNECTASKALFSMTAALAFSSSLHPMIIVEKILARSL